MSPSNKPRMLYFAWRKEKQENEVSWEEDETRKILFVFLLRNVQKGIIRIPVCLID